MTIRADQVFADACQKYRALCQSLLANRETDWPTICPTKSEVHLAKRFVILRAPDGRYLRRYHFQRDGTLWEPELCRECQKPIRDCYMAKAPLWQHAGYGPLDLVCPRCLERKVGRRLGPEDFDRMHPWVSRPVKLFRQVRGHLRKGFRHVVRELLGSERLLRAIQARRLRFGRRLLAPYAGQKLLDYRCGEGQFLAEVRDLFPDAVGADADVPPSLLGMEGYTFVRSEELQTARHEGAYQVVVCREVFEHCPDERWERLLDELRRLMVPEGTILINVPVEIGPSLLGKQVVRTVLGWLGVGEPQARERYTLVELRKMVFAGAQTRLVRPVYRENKAEGPWNPFHGHKGFNWRQLSVRVAQTLLVKRLLFSPFGWSHGWLSSQVWLLCQRPPTAARGDDRGVFASEAPPERGVREPAATARTWS